MKKLLQTLFFFLLLTQICFGQIIETTNSEGLTIEYYGVNSQESIERTQVMRDAQKDIMLADNGEDIVFVSNDDIYVQFADGTGRRLLIQRGSGISGFTYPAWSLDGSKLAFAAKRTDPRIVDLCVANADGSNITVIFTFNMGYYQSHINSISWHYSNQYIMFSVAYNDAQLNAYFFIATIHYTGSNVSYGSGFDHTYSQYEPVNNSSRYAYTSSGIPGYFNSELRVTNLSGTYTEVWLKHNNVVSGLTHVCWNNSNSIYTIIRNWSQYPNKEVLVRVNKSGSNYTFTTLIFSDLNASLWSPTVSPDRGKMYFSELTSSSLMMYLITFDQNGNVSTVQPKGAGAFSNWRQALPLPGQVTLLSPSNNATGVKINPVLKWQAVPTATSYELKVYNIGGTLVYSNDQIQTTQQTIGPLSYSTLYLWIVRAKNSVGWGSNSSPFKFTTQNPSDVDDEKTIEKYDLSQNYPNPFNPSTKIKYSIPELSFVTLKLSDVLGNEVATLVDEYKPAGRYEVEFQSAVGNRQLASGIYFYKLQAVDPSTGSQYGQAGQGYTAVKKMILIK